LGAGLRLWEYAELGDSAIKWSTKGDFFIAQTFQGLKERIYAFVKTINSVGLVLLLKVITQVACMQNLQSKAIVSVFELMLALVGDLSKWVAYIIQGPTDTLKGGCS
jgi:hypothetical protein